MKLQKSFQSQWGLHFKHFIAFFWMICSFWPWQLDHPRPRTIPRLENWYHLDPSTPAECNRPVNQKPATSSNFEPINHITMECVCVSCTKTLKTLLFCMPLNSAHTINSKLIEIPPSPSDLWSCSGANWLLHTTCPRTRFHPGQLQQISPASMILQLLLLSKEVWMRNFRVTNF